MHVILQGDSGGPMIVQTSDGKWTAIGVVSFTYRICDDPRYPAGFIRISKYRDWIDSKTGFKNV